MILRFVTDKTKMRSYKEAKERKKKTRYYDDKRCVKAMCVVKELMTKTMPIAYFMESNVNFMILMSIELLILFLLFSFPLCLLLLFAEM